MGPVFLSTLGEVRSPERLVSASFTSPHRECASLAILFIWPGVMKLCIRSVFSLWFLTQYRFSMAPAFLPPPFDVAVHLARWWCESRGPKQNGFLGHLSGRKCLFPVIDMSKKYKFRHLKSRKKNVHVTIDLVYLRVYAPGPQVLTYQPQFFWLVVCETEKLKMSTDSPACQQWDADTLQLLL